MPYPTVTRADVEEALQIIDGLGIPHGRGATRYSLVVTNPDGSKCCYPPKLVLSYAAKVATGEFLPPSEFSGGAAHANRIFSKLGFSVDETGPNLCIQSPDALTKLGKLEGTAWLAKQKREGAALDNGFYVNLAAFKILKGMGKSGTGLTLTDLDKHAGIILGAAGTGYVVFPDGEVAMIGDTASEAQKALADRMLRII
jgi:hypothetical protein